jgi:signal transduction histidine kinase
MTTLVEKILTGLAPDSGGAGELFDLHPVPSLLLARSGVITAANDAALRLFRCGMPDLVGGAMVGFFPELGSGLAEIHALTHHARVAVRRPDASNFIARVNLAPLARGADATLLVTLEDQTEFEDAISANNKELESFMSVAGHDLRGPLRILKGFAEALEDECGAVLNEEGRGFLKEILKAGDRMDGLIEGLLTLSRAARAEMTCENLDLSTLIELVTYELRHGKDGREVEF